MRVGSQGAARSPDLARASLSGESGGERALREKTGSRRLRSRSCLCSLCGSQRRAGRWGGGGRVRSQQQGVMLQS